jgi:hypothetical protein
MDPVRFDQLSKRFALRRLSRRQTLRGFVAAGSAGALFSLRRDHAAADCPDIGRCTFLCDSNWGPNTETCSFAIPGGPYGSCWNLGGLWCQPCHTTWADLEALCSSACAGGKKCTAAYGMP